MGIYKAYTGELPSSVRRPSLSPPASLVLDLPLLDVCALPESIRVALIPLHLSKQCRDVQLRTR